MNIKRPLRDKIRKGIKNVPVTAILGARQVGKTTLAKSIIAEYNHVKYLDLEKSSDVELLHNPEQYFNLNKNVFLYCIDEIQLKPDLYSALRSFVDENSHVRFLVLGSASPVLLRQSAETLAGRIFYYELNPFSYTEIKSKKTLEQYHLLGGFPKSILSDTATAFEWLQNFVKTFLERDLQMFGYTIPPIMLRRLWIMLAHLNGQLSNYASLSRAMGVDEKTVKKYIDILHNTYMLRLLQPYYVNVKKRLVKAPKIYLRDAGILHSLLGITSYENLYANPIYGTSWEGLIIENILSKFTDWEPYFYRTAVGAEIDLVLVKGFDVIAIEIKSSITPKLSKGFWIAMEDVKANKAYIIAPVKEAYVYKNDVLVYNLEGFLKLDI
ncbi:MAG: ATP-binding protein [Cyclobacteriaceae bacterium]|nr:ATP-binding protein [Cyclobacteriaceae bacterium]